MRIEDFSLDLIPKTPGVYLMKDSQGKVLYVGKAKNLRNRIAMYFHKKGDVRERIPFLMQKTAFLETITVSNETEALLLENNLIKKYHPKYNVLLKDDKTFFCLAISLQHPWPKIEAIRCRSVHSTKKHLIFGPYVSSEACRALLDVLGLWFPLRTCSDKEFAIRKRPCVLYEMKRCLAPCVNLCSHEEYQAVLEKAILFLKGKMDEVISQLESAIQTASKQLKFEQAAAYYRTLTLIKQAMTKQNVEKFHMHNIDAIGLYRNQQQTVLTILTVRSGKLLGAKHYTFFENAQEDQDVLTSFILQFYTDQTRLPQEILSPLPLTPQLGSLLHKGSPPHIRAPKTGYRRELVMLAKHNAEEFAKTSSQSVHLPYEEMKTMLNIKECPYRIECYDNSHLQGTHAIGVYIVFENDRLVPQHYRTFSLTPSVAKNDLRALEEVLLRRFSSLTSPLPNMIVIDGGRSHYICAKKILETLNLTGIEIVSLAKEASNHSASLTREKIYTDTFPKGVQLLPTAKVLQFFQFLRDEAHRFAIHTHRKKRNKELFTQEKIPGIGKVKYERLLKHFKSWKNVMKASQEELETIPGLTQKDVQRLLAKQSH
ncbi:excinuclease ABC subunit UvrC [Chlamydia pecorum]|uniref:excinuclease ABC subunit UvrC n=1 Tax=Chlamydia pecorum TaxID=85991 RepID=UPI0003ADD20E|nr:excinuclease ABC subunit UvrC [Chlamydia pecorum]AGW39187.1 excinuclease ABC, C subunit [Chlamydia pecorum W73]AGW40113.1 excinuclease ABC, subunit C [Chlamydia pecorum P787]